MKRPIPATAIELAHTTISIRKVITETIAFQEHGPFQTYGDTLNQLLFEAARANEEVQSLTLEITPDKWHEYAQFITAREGVSYSE